MAHPNARARARKPRLEFPGPCYHVINRGHYRADVFAQGQTKATGESPFPRVVFNLQ